MGKLANWFHNYLGDGKQGTAFENGSQCCGVPEEPVLRILWFTIDIQKLVVSVGGKNRKFADDMNICNVVESEDCNLSCRLILNRW